MNRSAYDLAHVKSVSVAVLLHPDKPGEIAGRIVANHSDNPAGSVCTATVHIWAGPLSFLRGCTGKAGGYGYDKLSAAIYSALSNAPKSDGAQYSGDPAALAAFKVDGDFAGDGFGSVCKWFARFGYSAHSVVGCH